MVLAFIRINNQTNLYVRMNIYVVSVINNKQQNKQSEYTDLLFQDEARYFTLHELHENDLLTAPINIYIMLL